MESEKQSILFHERPITDLKFHRDGDIFFASSKDASASIINLQGRILGTFDKHKGAISTLGPFQNKLATAGADLALISWDVLTGREEKSVETQGVVRGVDYDKEIYICTDGSMNMEPYVGMIDPRVGQIDKLVKGSDPGSGLFKTGHQIIFSATNGKICKLDLRNREIVDECKIHQAKITDIKPSACRGYFITTSADCTGKIVDTKTFTVKKRFDSEDPINSGAIFSTNDKAVCVGGINARDVTVTQGKSSFETQFFDIVTQKKIGSFTTHFGTINAVDVHPVLEYYVSGGEDGSICIVKLGDDFRKAPFTKLP